MRLRVACDAWRVACGARLVAGGWRLVVRWHAVRGGHSTEGMLLRVSRVQSALRSGTEPRAPPRSCHRGWTGTDCTKRTACPTGCESHGVCADDFNCVCYPGFGGDACEVELTCPGECSGHGRCDGVKCLCDEARGHPAINQSINQSIIEHPPTTTDLPRATHRPPTNLPSRPATRQPASPASNSPPRLPTANSPNRPTNLLTTATARPQGYMGDDCSVYEAPQRPPRLVPSLAGRGVERRPRTVLQPQRLVEASIPAAPRPMSRL